MYVGTMNMLKNKNIITVGYMNEDMQRDDTKT